MQLEGVEMQGTNTEIAFQSIISLSSRSLRCVPQGELNGFAINFDVGYKVFKYSGVLQVCEA